MCNSNVCGVRRSANGARHMAAGRRRPAAGVPATSGSLQPVSDALTWLSFCVREEASELGLTAVGHCAPVPAPNL